MPIRYRIDRERQLVFTHVEGVIGDEDVLGYAREFPNDPHFEAGYGGLVDATGLERVEVTPEGVRGVAHLTERLEKVFAGAKVAIVAVTDVAFGMARMYQGVRGDVPYEIRVFRDLGEARRWLGLPDA